MTATHALLCYIPAVEDEAGLRATSALCKASGLMLSVVLPVVRGRATEGPDDARWHQLAYEHAQGAARRAERYLVSMGSPPTKIVVESGPSIREVSVRVAAAIGCDVIVVVPRRWPWSETGLSRRQIRKLRGTWPGKVVELSRDEDRRSLSALA